MIHVGLFRKRPVVIEAVRYTIEDREDVIRWCRAVEGPVTSTLTGLRIVTLEGTMIANVGDWIIKGVNGEFYPCKPDVFAKTYEPVEHRPT